MTPSGFMYHGVAYAFADVVALRSYRLIHRTHHIPMGVSTEHDPAIGFVVYTKDGETIQVSEKSTLLSSSKEARIDLLAHAVDEISEKTFQQRVQKYVDQVQRGGQFQYAGWRFFPGQQKVVDPKVTPYGIAQTEFLRGFGYLQVVSRSEGGALKFLRKAKDGFTGNVSNAINTIEDTDAFYALLSHYFQLKWS